MNKTPYKIDLHTHSIISYDGGLTEKDYSNLLANNILDFIAITDHNEINFAVYLQRKLGGKIIIGEEIKTLEGEIIGLFLKEKVAPKLSIKETMKRIHSQNGLVYIPHAFEVQRESISYNTFLENKNEIDIIEVFNARSFGRKKTHQTKEIAEKLKISQAASSDAHCYIGIASSFTLIYNSPTKDNLRIVLKNAQRQEKYASPYSYLCPFINKIKHKLHV
ncbi:MAG TPA: PHP domain-containing protein [Patescibacteria group bacterium]